MKKLKRPKQRNRVAYDLNHSGAFKNKVIKDKRKEQSKKLCRNKKGRNVPFYLTICSKLVRKQIQHSLAFVHSHIYK